MKRINQLILLSLIISLNLFSGCKEAKDLGGCKFTSSMDNYEMVWSDEFDGSAIDESKWSYDIGDGCQISNDLCGWGNNELEYYTARPENSFINNGNLVIEAKKEFPLYLGQHEYTSARMVTKNKGDWKYGRLDIRAKMPIGQGLWPAIWMLPTDEVYGGWPRSGEIDIMEYLGNEPQNVFGTIHYGHDFWRFNSQGLELEEGSFAEEFHVFTVLWNEDCIQFQMDGINIGEPNTRSTVLPTTYPFDQRFHLILNVAVGGNLPGNPNASTSFPQTMEVDYVRVYQEK
ncbi:MAG: glycoside hydrolase family 16 protein [Saprospiraceae bacterium]